MAVTFDLKGKDGAGCHGTDNSSPGEISMACVFCQEIILVLSEYTDLKYFLRLVLSSAEARCFSSNVPF